MRFLLLPLLLCISMIPAFAASQESATDKGTLLINISTEPETPIAGEQTKIKIDFINPQTKSVQEHIDYQGIATNGDSTLWVSQQPIEHTSRGSVTIPMELKTGQNKISIDVQGIFFREIPTEHAEFVVAAQDKPQASAPATKPGCLIATATYGTELAPQVQTLREVRDNVLFSTGSGTAFMAGFNDFYYAFSPTIADWERQSPLFKEIVKTTIAPMLFTMSILNYVNINSEQQMLGYGIGVILLNMGMYFVAPAIIIAKVFKRKLE